MAEEEIRDLNLHIKKTLFGTGQASIASTKINGNTFLKFTLLNPMTTKKDIEHIIHLIMEEGERFQTTMMESLTIA